MPTLPLLPCSVTHVSCRLCYSQVLARAVHPSELGQHGDGHSARLCLGASAICDLSRNHDYREHSRGDAFCACGQPTEACGDTNGMLTLPQACAVDINSYNGTLAEQGMCPGTSGSCRGSTAKQGM